MKKARKFGAVFFWLLCAVIMYVIFRFSSETGEESKQVSEGLLSVIIQYIGNVISHNVLRKIAHFTEYAALGFCMSGAIYFSFRKRNFVSLIPCAVYALGDEIHQYFVPERACRVFDIFIDTCGSAVGILIFLLIAFLIKKLRKIKTKKTQFRTEG